MAIFEWWQFHVDNDLKCGNMVEVRRREQPKPCMHVSLRCARARVSCNDHVSAIHDCGNRFRSISCTIHLFTSNARTVLYERGSVCEDDYIQSGTACGGGAVIEKASSKSVTQHEDGAGDEDKPAPDGTDSARVHNNGKQKRKREERGVDTRPKHGSRLRYDKKRRHEVHDAA
jgi:hypothetical protein